MTAHHARVLALAAVLVGISALILSPSVRAQQPVSGLPLEVRVLAEQGDASAQFRLGFMYDNGMESARTGVPKDAAGAIRLYRLAACQGDANAQDSLGCMYMDGRGTPQDYVEAHMWFNLAASQLSGDDRDRAVRNRDDVAGHMTADQIAEAQRRAREWTPTPEP